MRAQLTDHPLPGPATPAEPTEVAHHLDEPDWPAPAHVTVTLSLPDPDNAPPWVLSLSAWLNQLAGEQPAGERGEPARTEQPQATLTPLPDLMLNPVARTARLAGHPVRLTRLEFDLLLFLITHSGQVFTRAQLMQQIWGTPAGRGERTVDVHIRRLRVHLAGNGPAITTVHGIGYRLDHSDRATVTPRRPATRA
ncbi:winged helix-turn-helix domain-containing protein [Actinoplanes sp. NEAU-A12]|uniref:Winged helix-turn-helix domain-containing protein n=1 Tax=Actinoplanes sandaracinus TaxID=3045177 RepID=A0ABT6WYL2_9ACTN|nr:winged helix-turn-helix domain-containing protein [Actinoplanes sandaracinus]MDI6104828.1 winged helix-turn-helix domain-containing protein [Actinoplanes sandaracinus]